MQAIDFEYDDQCLSDYNFIICDFDFSDGASEASAGSTITFKKVSRNGGKIYSVVNSQYEECITATFDICKDPEIFEKEDMEITSYELREIMRWLNRKDFHKLQFLNDDDTCFYNASFNITKIKVADRVCGLRLKMETDKPFGYGVMQTFKWSVSSATDIKNIYDVSDEIGYIYPDVEITVKEDGLLKISNSADDRETVIRNCKSGEKINFYGESQIITSSYDNHDICNDFLNYNFPRIINTLKDRDNKITVSLPCDIILKYSPIIKDSI